jgi:diguanylate cyclase
VSAGVACWNGRESAEELVGRADAALYEAKRTGRDRLVAAGDAPGDLRSVASLP